MIHRAKFQNFKALRNVEATFDSRLTVLVGPNGSGKTSVLQGVHFLSQAAEFGASGGDFNVGSLQAYISSGADTTDLFLEAAGAYADSEEVVVQILATKKVESKTAVRLQGPITCVTHFRRDGQQAETVHGVPPQDVTRAFRSTTLLRLDAARLAAPSQMESVPPVMKPDGGGLASTLAYLALNQPDQFHEIVTVFQTVIRTVSRLRFERVTGGASSESLLFDFHGATGVKAQFVSSGTLFALGLITAIMGPKTPNVLLLDDLDHGLHPKAQMELVDVLRKLLDQYSDLQIIATSHSPYILDRLEPREVRMMALKDDGSAVCRPLTDHPDFERWKESMSPGEFWSTFYEDWLTRKPEPQPAP